MLEATHDITLAVADWYGQARASGFRDWLIGFLFAGLLAGLAVYTAHREDE